MKTPAERRLSHSRPPRKLDRSSCPRHALEKNAKIVILLDSFVCTLNYKVGNSHVLFFKPYLVAIKCFVVVDFLLVATLPLRFNNSGST